MLKIGIVGCGLQAATIAGHMGIYGDAYEVAVVMDLDFENAQMRIKQKEVRLAADCVFCHTLEEFMAAAGNLNGILIGTYCASHTEVACRLEVLGIPLYLEKPVSVSLEQLRTLYRTFRDSATPVEVSLPMRLCPLVQRAKKVIDSGLLGPIWQVIGHENTSGEIYFTTWFRDEEKTGGMFLQKAVHDIDYMFYLAGGFPVEVCAMRAKLYHTGDKPYDLTCDQCPDFVSCPEGPFMSFYQKGFYKSVPEALENIQTSITPDGRVQKQKFCAFSKKIGIEDVGECIIRMDNGIHIAHSQNFIACRMANSRGARFCGSDATLELDFNHSSLKLLSHRSNSVEEYQIDPGQLSHYGGDRELVLDFLKTMKYGERGRSDLITGNGIMSTLTCLCARESAEKRRFTEIVL